MIILRLYISKKLCVNNKLSELSCPNGLLFDNSLKKCNYNNLVSCNELMSTLVTTSVFSNTTNIRFSKLNF
jgi:hypothetical protein